MRIKIGDLVQLTFYGYWQISGGSAYTENPLLVTKVQGHTVMAIDPSTGKKYTALRKHFKVVSERA